MKKFSLLLKLSPEFLLIDMTCAQCKVQTLQLWNFHMIKSLITGQKKKSPGFVKFESSY